MLFPKRLTVVAPEKSKPLLAKMLSERFTSLAPSMVKPPKGCCKLPTLPKLILPCPASIVNALLPVTDEPARFTFPPSLLV